MGWEKGRGLFGSAHDRQIAGRLASSQTKDSNHSMASSSRKTDHALQRGLLLGLQCQALRSNLWIRDSKTLEYRKSTPFHQMIIPSKKTSPLSESPLLLLHRVRHQSHVNSKKINVRQFPYESSLNVQNLNRYSNPSRN
jgi:hypothetical protein